ncbi:GNAT family N-acetyltransferase [Anaerovibrio sp. JC8]|jgi:GNAT superfamily N-acetyltransferase|uniref:GNAT family N-acetyltransferase n=1 Tax=Anaerovibrio sp. JC8 TaxID=1240085 RepID=UPI000A10644F|nr:GNAT family N-acetyltransferase [Anaerovibrio sp. JC8]
MMGLSIKRLDRYELKSALKLVWEVFLEYEAPDYTQEGIDEFFKSIHDENYLTTLTAYGAFLDECLIGVIATRNSGKHIALFFVEGKYHHQGVGKQLFETVRTNKMTVNSSPYAVPIYKRLGFFPVNSEQVVNGLRFTPMELQ